MSLRIEELSGWDSDVAAVADRMRKGDSDELWELTRTTPHDALARSIPVSQETYIAYWGDVPVAVFGTHTASLGGFGVPWLLGTDEVADHPLRFMRMSRRYIAHIRQKHTKLQNVVHAENSASILYLSALGFAMSKPYKTLTGAMAITFEMEGFGNV